MTLPFYLYSSKHRPDGRMHPVVARRMERILDMWVAMSSMADIAESLQISPDTVRNYLRKARLNGDARMQIRPVGYVRKAGPVTISRFGIRARVRRQQIKSLHKAGFSKQEIAKMLHCDVRLVQMRLKEAA